MRVRFRLDAAEDVELARDWYDAQRPGLGNEFVASLERTLELVVGFPAAFPEIAGGCRRALLSRFPYSLYYRLDRDMVEVLACLHSTRAPDAWRARE